MIITFSLGQTKDLKLNIRLPNYKAIKLTTLRQT